MFEVYCHTNRVNDLRYIGFSSRGIEKRWLEHTQHAKNGSMKIFHQAIRHFGEENFDHDVICYAKSLKEAKILERHFIEMLGTWGGGYNMTRGRNGNGSALRGRSLSVEHREKLKSSSVGRPKSSEHRQRMRAAKQGKLSSRKGKSLSEEQKALQRKLKNEFYASVEGETTKQKIREKLIGRHLSDECKAKISAKGKGRKHSSKAIQKMKNHKFSDEHRRKLSEAAKRRYLSGGSA